MTERKRPRKTITLDPDTIAYIDNYAAGHGGLDFSRALEAIILEHAGGIAAAVLAAAVGTATPPPTQPSSPASSRTPTQWTE